MNIFNNVFFSSKHLQMSLNSEILHHYLEIFYIHYVSRLINIDIPRRIVGFLLSVKKKKKRLRKSTFFPKQITYGKVGIKNYSILYILKTFNIKFRKSAPRKKIARRFFFSSSL